MPKNEKKKLRYISGFAAGCLVFMLVNQSVRLIDLFPSFIACLILARRLTYYSDRAPYFAECRDALIKLGFLNLLQGPAFIVAAMIKAGNVSDHDTMVLFNFIFATAECLFLINAVRHFFSAAFYMGMRGAASAIAPIYAFGLKIKPEHLRDAAYIFIVLRALGTALPEMLLLSSSDIVGAYQATYDSYIYSRLTIFILPVLFLFAILISVMFGKYLKAITKSGELSEQTELIIDGARKSEIERKRLSGDKKFIFTLLGIAVILSCDIRLVEFSMIDIIPNYISGLIIFSALLMIFKENRPTVLTLCAAAVFTVCSFISVSRESKFLEEYGYGAIQWEEKARDAYIDVINLSMLEFITLALMYILLAFTLISFLKKHTLLKPSADTHDRSSRRQYTFMKIKVCIFAFLGIANGLSKFFYTIFNSEITSSFINTGNSVEIAVFGLVPWFGTFLTIAFAVYLGYSLFIFSGFKDEIELKYS